MIDTSLSLEALRTAVATNGVAVRAITRLLPAGGPSDKVFPPTYAGSQYVYEDRWIAGERVRTVLLDSVQSQANRMEQALLEACRGGRTNLPLIETDFSSHAELADIGKITALDAPHRIADAIFRDSLYAENGSQVPFRLSEPGKRFTNANTRNATALFELCPTALVLGMWDSTGPRGGLGAKFERALVSEIIGVDPVTGRRTGGRLDPLQIRRTLGEGYEIYRHRDPTRVWTFDADEAETDEQGRPRRYGRRGTPSEVNHGNIPPDLARAKEDVSTPNRRELIVRQDQVLDGGVTIRYAIQTTVLSLVALRRLSFPVNGQSSPDRDTAARTTLAATALAMVVLQREQGYDLRSRCLLLPQEPLAFELILADGRIPTSYALDAAKAAQLLDQAAEDAKTSGLKWDAQPLALVPAPKLVRLAARSRELEMQTAPEEAGAS